VPGTDGLCIELRPKGRIPSGDSKSTLFFEDASGDRRLRLDYGYNVRTRTIDYHWNQQRTHADVGAADRSSAGRTGDAAHAAARYFRHAGRVMAIAGVAIELLSVVRASRSIRRASPVVAGWAAAWAGCEVVGAGASGGLLGSSPGSSFRRIPGCVIGGIGGHYGGSAIGGEVYGWAEDTFFVPLPEVDGP
jgi:hypothetical protein